MPTSPVVHVHKSYLTEPVALGAEHGGPLHKLAVSVNWPHRPEDMDWLLKFGQGYLASDEIGRPIGSGMVFSYGSELAMIGMMMTHPKLQAGGLGDHILNRLIEQAGTDRLRLNSTTSAHRLYRNAGFVETGTVHQYQGIVTEQNDTPSDCIRTAQADDFAAISDLDRQTFGAARTTVLQGLMDVSDAIVVVRDGAVTGFALCRPFGRGEVIGPLSAGSEEDAIALVSWLLKTRTGKFLRLDADARHKALETYLNARGLATYDKVVPMVRGGATGPEAAIDRTYALASQALG